MTAREDLTVASDIEGMWQAAASYLSERGYNPEWPACLSIKKDDADPIVGHCRQILFYAHGTLRHLSNDNGNDAVWCAMRLMKHAMTADFHGWRSLAVTGQKSRRGGKKGSERAHGKPEDLMKRNDAMQKRVNEMHREHPEYTREKLNEKVADEFGVSTRTIERHTTNPLK